MSELRIKKHEALCYISNETSHATIVKQEQRKALNEVLACI